MFPTTPPAADLPFPTPPFFVPDGGRDGLPEVPGGPGDVAGGLVSASGEVPGALSLDTVLAPYVTVFTAAFVIAYVFTPVMRHVALAYGIVDRPDLDRKLHRRPVAYLGGVAVFLGFVGALAICHLFVRNHNPFLSTGRVAVLIPPAIIVSALVIVSLGLLDDLRGVKPKVKILGQVAAAVTLLAWGIGTRTADPFVRGGFEWVHLNVGLSVPGAVEAGVSVVASCLLVIGLVVFCCNASNLMDGLDGLCGGVTALIALGLVVVAAYLAMTGPIDRASGDAVRLVIALALFGAVLGFLPFNFNPASIFMGDTGSLFMGFIVATSIVLLGEVGAKWMLAGLVMFSLPVLDTALAFARRWVNGRPLFSADRHHFHHQLVARGLSVRRAVVLSYGLTVFFVACGAALLFVRTRYAASFYLVLFACIVVAAYKMGMVHERPLREAVADEAEAGSAAADPVAEAGADTPPESEEARAGRRMAQTA